MVDITKYPYFSYNQQIEPLARPLTNQANVHFLNFIRKYHNRERICIVVNKAHTVDWCASEFYKHSVFETPDVEEKSAFYMWDHMPHTQQSLAIRSHNIRKHNIAHGLSVVKKYDGYCDNYVFATTPGNDQVHNFYLNQKEVFEKFVQAFDKEMKSTILELENHKIFIPENISSSSKPVSGLSSRQMDCALLMTEGHTAKEIGKALSLSHRTVEDYIEVLKHKFDAKNRLHLVKKLQGLL
jgi:DNA-binding CsgD family transcriptional regulator